MPELPDVVVYLEALTRHVVGERLENIKLFSPFVLRSVEPPLDAVFGRNVTGVRRVGKRIVLEFEPNSAGEPPVFLVIHLIITQDACAGARAAKSSASARSCSSHR